MTNSLPTQNRLQYIDIARGIAIICIVLGHLGISSISNAVFTFHVPIFYFISGYFIHGREPETVFIKKKARSLLVPYAVTCVIMVILGALKSLYYSGAEEAVKSAEFWLYAALYGAGSNAKAPLFLFKSVRSIGAIWFLWATFWGSVFLHGLLGVNLKYRIAVILLISVISVWSSNYIWLPLSVQAGGIALLFMYLGFCLQKCTDFLRNIPKEIKAVWTIYAFAIWIAFIRDMQDFSLVRCAMGRGVIDIFCCICACYCIVLLSKILEQYATRLANGLAYIGRYSLIMLCVHIIELNLLPWNPVINSIGIPNVSYTGNLILGKMILNIGMTVILSKNKFVRRIFALK